MNSLDFFVKINGKSVFSVFNGFNVTGWSK